MAKQAIVTGIELPTTSHISVRIEVSSQINVSGYIARQKANRFLILQAGDQLCAGEPELVVGPRVYWRVPAQFAPSRLGPLGIAGHLLVDADTGEVTVADGQTTDDLMQRAEALYARAAS
ncbi:MAG: hypothetical protein HY741_01185 [Chloroflexi bacterium]|nr:hypothetical protein [Chloroflexota bacterium]